MPPTVSHAYPTGHDKQSDIPANEYVPFAHAVAETPPVHFLPAGHSIQADDAVVEVVLPGGQLIHVSAPAKEYLPIAHACLALPAPQKCPAVHGVVLFLEPDGQYMPGLQSKHIPPGEYFPAGQL